MVGLVRGRLPPGPVGDLKGGKVIGKEEGAARLLFAADGASLMR